MGKLFSDEVVCLVSQDHPAVRRKWTLQKLAGERHWRRASLHRRRGGEGHQSSAASGAAAQANAIGAAEGQSVQFRRAADGWPLGGYPERKLFDTQDIVLVAGECAALIGGNGIGKTTFLRTLRQEIAPLEGTLKYGQHVQIGYFAQAHQNLIADNSVLDELMRHKPRPMSEARALLARYLFRNDDVHKPIKALSGGERAKLALAILASEGANLLVLDEPTNHLDIPSQEALQDVLETFEGTILMVTHDRYLVDRLATQVWTVEAGLLNVFQGTYREFLAADRQMA
ncbi:MAG: ATP-binding cassette domain-containing protein [Sphingopyxis sp.]|nr:ATP-binding cassette domain-containing protein [Sphingopyxis sp.]